MTARCKLFLTAAAILTCAGTAAAGNLDAPAGPSASGSALFTLNAIYNRLATGAAGAKRSGPFAEPTAGPSATVHTTDAIMAAAPAADNTNGATVANVLSGKTFWGLRTDGTWGLKTGTVAAGGNVTGANGSLSITIPAGLYPGSSFAMASDANLVAGNIKSGATIFGVAGSYGGGGGGASLPWPVPRTGQTTVYATGDDGAWQKGVSPPAPRFTGNGNGTVTDNATGLVWLENANCNDTVAGIEPFSGSLSWSEAIVWSNNLADGFCGLSDGSTASQWRLPNLRELQSLIDYKNFDPPLPDGHGTHFSGVQSDFFWSSTTNASDTSSAWIVFFYNGFVYPGDKTEYYYVWPVRGGQ